MPPESIHADLRADMERMMSAIFDVIDGCDRALTGAVDRDDPMVKGMVMLREQALAAAGRAQLVPINPEGERFDPSEHEAVSALPGGEAGMIAQVLRRGWRHRELLVRPAHVVVHDGRSGCPHGRPSPGQCLQCFRDQRAAAPSETARRRQHA